MINVKCLLLVLFSRGYQSEHFPATLFSRLSTFLNYYPYKRIVSEDFIFMSVLLHIFTENKVLMN